MGIQPFFRDGNIIASRRDRFTIPRVLRFHHPYVKRWAAALSLEPHQRFPSWWECLDGVLQVRVAVVELGGFPGLLEIGGRARMVDVEMDAPVDVVLAPGVILSSAAGR